VKALAAFLVGGLFGLGLAVAQMVDPGKVLGFLDPIGGWDPSLALVMGGGLAVTLVSFRWVLRRPGPILAPRFFLPGKSSLDGRLIGGAVLFGMGWGLAGYCPGPALTALSFGWVEPWIFVASMALGSWLGATLLDRPEAEAAVSRSSSATADG
jgi:uncharacterized protein